MKQQLVPEEPERKKEGEDPQIASAQITSCKSLCSNLDLGELNAAVYLVN